MNGNKIKHLRNEVGLTQTELGEKLGVVKQTVSSWENNVSEPKGDTLIQLSKILGTSPNYLLDDSLPTTSATRYAPEQYDTSVKYWVDKTGDSYSEIATKLGIPENILMDYINECVDIPYSILISLSELCQVSTDCLLGLADKSREKDLDNILPFQYNYNIAQRIEELRNPITDTDSFLCMLLSISEKELYYLTEYGFVPHMDTIIKLSDYFNVSCDFLLCTIDEQEEKALSTFRMLNEDNRDIFLGDMKKALLNQKSKGSSTVAANEASQYIDAEKKSYPSSGTGGMGA